LQSPDFVICPVLKLVHEGEIASHYVSLIALNAHPTFSRIAISEHPSVDMSPAQFAVLVTQPEGTIRVPERTGKV
jgi:hypothetical protein